MDLWPLDAQKKDKGYTKPMDSNNKQTHHLINLSSKYNFMKETAFNLQRKVLKSGFRKFHPQPQESSSCGFE